MAEPIPKYHLYKVWDISGRYLGTLKNVSSLFQLGQDINSIGPASITVNVAQSGDTSYLPVKAITTEDGKIITTEDGKYITTEGEPENYGVSGSMIRNGNIVRIIEYSNYHPNGFTAYTGKVKKFSVNIGSQDDMSIMLVPLSTDLNNHIMKSGEVLHSGLTAQTSSEAIFGDRLTTGQRVGYQLPTPSRGMVNISSLRLRLSAQSAGTPATVTARVFNTYSNSPPAGSEGANLSKMNDLANALGSASVVVTGTTAQDYTLNFDTPIQLSGQEVLTLSIESSGASGSGANIFYTTADSYGNGVLVRYASGVWDYPSYLAGELYYQIYQIPPYTNATLTNFEPSDMVKRAVSNYISEGGLVRYTASSIATTGITVPSYTFKLTTVRLGIKTFLDLSPAGFYYYVDPGTNELTFKQVNTTPDHLLILKRHMQSLNLSASIMDLKNSTYFTGGLVGATNLLRQRENGISKGKYGIELELLTNIQVTNTSTADRIADNFIDRNDDELYDTVVTVLESVEDTTQYKLGQTVGIRNTGNSFVESLVLPIVRIEREYDWAKLYLGALPFRETDLINESQEQLLALQTVDNPNQPS